MLTAELRARLDRVVTEATAAELPDVIGVLAALQARAFARLAAPSAAVPQSTEWVTAREVSRHFKLSISTVNELARANKLPHKMYGRYRRFNLADLAGHDIDGVGIEGRKAA